MADQTTKIDTIRQAQNDMCQAYANGSVGIIASGFIWLLSAFVVFEYSAKQGIWTLFIGGMFIFPLSILLSKIVGLSGNYAKGNPLGRLAMEGTIFMLFCLPLAFALSLQHTEWFFQAMLLIIGGRYFTFATIYGNRLFWILGAALGLAAFLLFITKGQPFISALTGGTIEITFGLFKLISFIKKTKNKI